MTPSSIGAMPSPLRMTSTKGQPFFIDEQQFETIPINMEAFEANAEAFQNMDKINFVTDPATFAENLAMLVTPHQREAFVKAIKTVHPSDLKAFADWIVEVMEPNPTKAPMSAPASDSNSSSSLPTGSPSPAGVSPTESLSLLPSTP